MAQQHLDLSPGGDKVGAAFGKVEANFGELYALALVVSAIQTALASKQPLDDDLTAIAAQGTQAFGRSLLAKNSDADTRSALGLVIGTTVQAWDVDLDAIAALTTTAFGRALLTAVDAPSLRTTLALGSAALLAAGTAGGAATLDGSTGKLLATQIPDALLGALRYQGGWNASTNSPALPTPSSANKGWYYIVLTAGSTSLQGPNGPITDWQLGDWAVSDGTYWEKVDSSDQVLMVAGLQGNITAAQLKTAIAIVANDITDASASGRAILTAASYAAIKTLLAITTTDVSGLGTAATKNVGTAANNVVQLDTSARLPAVDASQLINVPGTSGASVALDDFRTGMIQLAKVKGSVVLLAGGVADDFRDQTGYDTANSVNAVYDATNNLILNVAAEASQSLPAMTSNTAPSGYTASASSSTGATEAAYKAFDGVLSGGQDASWTTTLAPPQYVQRVNPASFRMASYAITTRTDNYGSPTAWTFYGTNDGGSTLVTLDSQSGQSFTSGQTRSFAIPLGSRGAFSGYRLLITSSADAHAAIAELQIFKEIPATLDLRSVAFVAQAVPTKGSIFVLVKATADTITANTNLLAKLSRDGGTTHTTATLTSTGTYAGFTVYEANGFDISSQPSGSSIKWRLQTVGSTLGVQVDAVVAQWG